MDSSISVLISVLTTGELSVAARLDFRLSVEFDGPRLRFRVFETTSSMSDEAVLLSPGSPLCCSKEDRVALRGAAAAIALAVSLEILEVFMIGCLDVWMFGRLTSGVEE